MRSNYGMIFVSCQSLMCLPLSIHISAIIIIDDGKFVKRLTPIDPPRITPYQMFIKRSYDNRAERYKWYNNITVL